MLIFKIYKNLPIFTYFQKHTNRSVMLSFIIELLLIKLQIKILRIAELTGAVFTIKIPTCVVEISKNIFKDNVNSTDEKFVFKVMKKQRHLYLNYIADGIKFPQEIWKYKYKGRERLNLLSRYKSKNGNIEIIAVFENKKSVFVGISAYQAIYDDYFERQRVGKRIYVKI